MKKVININFQGRVVMIEEVAYDQLKAYIESLRLHFAEEEGHEEIINDIESRISELFEEVIQKGNPCVTEEDLNAIIGSIGRPEDFETADLADAGMSGAAQSQSEHHKKEQGDAPGQHEVTGSGQRKHLYRDENNKKIGGVCSGLANYFNIDPTVARLIALILLFCYGIGALTYIILWICVPSSSVQVIGGYQRRLFRDVDNKTIGGVCAGLASYFDLSISVIKAIFLVGALISFPLTAFANIHLGGFFFPGLNFLVISIYIILWIVVPPAITASEKLSMKGEPVDLHNIKSAVQEDLQEGKKKTLNPHSATEPLPRTRHKGATLGDIIVLLFKIFGYFIIGVIIITILATLVSLGLGVFGFAPMKDYLIGGFWQNTYAWLAVILVIWMPVVAIIIWVIRRLINAKSNRTLGVVFVVLFIVGLVCSGLLIRSVYKDFSYVSAPVISNVPLSDPHVDKLTINLDRTTVTNYNHRRWSIFGSAFGLLRDSIRINNTKLILQRSATDSFTVTVIRIANGNSMEDADIRATSINTGVIQQQGASLLVPCAITVDKQNKFRNQYVLVVVGIPEGKKVEVHANRRWSNQFYVQFWDDDWDFVDFDDLEDLDVLGNASRFDRLHSSLRWELDREYLMTNDRLEPTKTDLEMRRRRIQSSEDIIEREKERIDREKKELERQMKDKQEELQRQIDRQMKELDNNSTQIESPLPLENSKAPAHDLAPVMWIGKSLLRLS